MFEVLTAGARRVVVFAQEEARALGHPWIGSEHLLLGLIREGEGIAAAALAGDGVPLERLRARVLQLVGEGSGTPEGHVPFTPGAKVVMEGSRFQSDALGHDCIGTEHLLLAILAEADGVGVQALALAGIHADTLRAQVLERIETAQAPGGPEDEA